MGYKKKIIMKREKTLVILKFICIGFIAFCGIAVLIDLIRNGSNML
tara:strand:+ start:2099 stop:2236 length:138 start_codon:yes stop_codon:yes gene_type:complete